MPVFLILAGVCLELISCRKEKAVSRHCTVAVEVAFRSRMFFEWQEGVGSWSSVGLGRNGRDSMALATSCCLSSRPMSMSSTALKASPEFDVDLCTASQRELVEMVDLDTIYL